MSEVLSLNSYRLAAALRLANNCVEQMIDRQSNVTGSFFMVRMTDGPNTWHRLYSSWVIVVKGAA
jgi:hypothetical protein